MNVTPPHPIAGGGPEACQGEEQATARGGGGQGEGGSGRGSSRGSSSGRALRGVFWGRVLWGRGFWGRGFWGMRRDTAGAACQEAVCRSGPQCTHNQQLLSSSGGAHGFHIATPLLRCPSDLPSLILCSSSHSLPHPPSLLYSHPPTPAPQSLQGKVEKLKKAATPSGAARELQVGGWGEAGRGRVGGRAIRGARGHGSE